MFHSIFEGFSRVCSTVKSWFFDTFFWIAAKCGFNGLLDVEQELIHSCLIEDRGMKEPIVETSSKSPIPYSESKVQKEIIQNEAVSEERKDPVLPTSFKINSDRSCMTESEVKKDPPCMVEPEVKKEPPCMTEPEMKKEPIIPPPQTTPLLSFEYNSNAAPRSPMLFPLAVPEDCKRVEMGASSLRRNRNNCIPS